MRSVGSDLPPGMASYADFAMPLGGCGRCFTRRDIPVDVVGESCPGLRHIEEGDLAG